MVSPRWLHPAPSPGAGTKGLFQLSVRHGGPADRAGVPTGSWLLELNGASVRSCSRAQLARKVRAAPPGMGAGLAVVLSIPLVVFQLKQSGSKMTLLVASGAVEEFYRLRGLQVPAAAADASWLPYKARELQMVKGPGGYGFLLKEDDYGAGAIGEGGIGEPPACAGGCSQRDLGSSSVGSPP